MIGPTSHAEAATVLTRRTWTITAILIVVVTVASFLGRYAFPVAGFRVRIEQLAPLILVAWMVFHPQLRRSFLATLRHPVVVVFAVFIAWNIVSTLIFSPDYAWSVSILAWLLIDLALLMAMMSLHRGAMLAGLLGRWSVIPWGTLGFAAFAAANLSHGLFAWGTDFDWLYEVYVARLTAIEANIYASILVFWAILAVTRRGASRWMLAGITVAVPLGLIASQTRTAVFSLLIGLGVYALYTLLQPGSPWRVRWARIIPATVLVVALGVSYGLVSMIPSDGTGRDATTVTESETYVPDPANPDTQNKIGDFDLEGGTIGFRITVADLAAQDMTGANLWFGNGTNTFGIRHEQPGTPGVSGHIIMLPVQILYDTGIVGLALLAALFTLVFVFTPRERKPVAAGLLAAYVLSATLTSMFWFSVTWILFAVLLRRTSPEPSRADADL